MLNILFWICALLTHAGSALAIWDLCSGGDKAGLGAFLFGLIIIPFLIAQIGLGFLAKEPSTLFLATCFLPIVIVCMALIKLF
jgi:hypothetical protein